MGINATLFGQMITFGLLVLFTMKFVWPPVIKALQDRQQKIADGLAAGERGRRELELSQHKSTEQLREAKIQAAKIIENADKQAAKIVDNGKAQARIEAEKIVQMTQNEIQQAWKNAREALGSEIAGIAIASAEKLLSRELDASANNDMINELISEVSGEK